MRYVGPFGVWWSWWIYIRTHLNETLYCVSTKSFDLLRHPPRAALASIPQHPPISVQLLTRWESKDPAREGPSTWMSEKTLTKNFCPQVFVAHDRMRKSDKDWHPPLWVSRAIVSPSFPPFAIFVHSLDDGPFLKKGKKWPRPRYFDLVPLVEGQQRPRPIQSTLDSHQRLGPSTQKCRSLLWSLGKVGGVWVGIPIARVPWHFVNGRPRDSIADGNPRKCGSHTTYKKRFDLLVKLYTAWLSWLFSQLWIALLHVTIEAESASSKKRSRDLLGNTKCYMRYI